MNPSRIDHDRRKLCRLGLQGLSTLFIAPLTFTSHSIAATPLRLATAGALQAPDENGIRLPNGLVSRIVAHSGQNLFSYQWHAAPDGGATFSTPDGGWIYVSNSERKNGKGGVGALRFSRQGMLVDAYSILQETDNNCAGGATPWQTWLSCEETERGAVWECDPFGKREPMVREALGRFKHEAVAVDTRTMQLYLTEDEPDGCLYRYTALQLDSTGFPNLTTGQLEVMQIIRNENNRVIWHPVRNPAANFQPTRKQSSLATHFNGGEGIWYHHGFIYFTTKGDNRVWELDTSRQILKIIYDASQHPDPVLTGVDNITANATGELLIAEDGGNMEIVILAAGMIKPLLQIIGQDHSEITGPAFSPDGSRLYFSSQRGISRRDQNGITYEISGF
ncbi:MAG: alkaline phosphatase PhoX [Nitrosomonas sp.]|nr:DUF839 domain-containing protein [Nitrosomonas sp.]MCC7135714.1 DUF839 domain-containing protein [Nitrosomonas sp.]